VKEEYDAESENGYFQELRKDHTKLHLNKRSPTGPQGQLAYYLSQSDPPFKVSNYEEEAPRKKKRGRHLQSMGLENHLLDHIQAQIKEMKALPDRQWISSKAKQYIRKNEVKLKCSKGWLDKFMKRNECALLQWLEAGNN